MSLPVDPNTGAAGQPATPPAPSQTLAPPAGAAAPQQAGQPAGQPAPSTMVQLPHNAFADLKRSAREKGAAKEREAFDSRAKALGFANADAAFAALSASRQPASGTPAPTPGQPGQPASPAPAAPGPVGQPAAPQGQNDEIAQMRARLETLERERTQAQLTDWMRASGVVDTKLAALALQDAAATGGENFDPAAWLNAQRTERPYLFAAAQPVAPAPAPLAPAAPAPGAPNNDLIANGMGTPAAPPAAPAPLANSGVPGNAAAAPVPSAAGTPATPKPFDATKATPAEIAARLRAQGLDVVASTAFRNIPAPRQAQ